MCGLFRDAVDFDPGPGNFILTSIGMGDGFVLKLNASGDFDWVVSYGDDWLANELIVDVNDDLILTGWCKDTVDFDPGIGVFNLITNGNTDAFVQKLDANADLIWAGQIGGTSTDMGSSIKTDSQGNVHISGYFSGTADFDPGAGVVNMSASTSATFVEKLDVNGAYVWAKSYDGGSPVTLELTTTGEVVVNGLYGGTIDFDPGPSVFNLTADPGPYDSYYILKLDVNGDFLWAISNDVDDMDIAVDLDSNVYTIGSFRDTEDFPDKSSKA